MPADDGWTTVTSSAASSASSASRAGRPQLSLIDILLMLWRAKWMIFLIALPFIAASVAIAIITPKEYSAHSRIQVTAGAERVFDPIVGNAQAMVLGQDEITGSEVELLGSPVIADRVIQKLGLDVIYPKMAKAMEKATPAERLVMYEKAVEGLQKDFSAGGAPKNPVIRTSYKNEDPNVAADTLNTIIETYLEYRAELFTRHNAGFLVEQRLTSERKLQQADEAIEHFLTTNRIGDFTTEKAAVAALYANVTDELFKVQAQKSEVDGRLAATSTQLELTSPTIDLNRETTYQQQLFDLKMQRAQLLATYQPGTPQVQALDRQIAETEDLIVNHSSNAAKIQTGPNEVFQTLQGRRSELIAEESAMRERFDALQRQKKAIEQRQLEITRLEPTYNELLRTRAILEDQVRNITVREEQERLKRDAARADFENIQILEPARIPSQGESKGKIIAAAGIVFGLGTGFMFALIWIFTRSTLPTAGSIARTSGLPILASVRPVK